MSNCSSCQRKFIFFKVLKLKCAECEQYYCVNCIRKSSGFKAYCETCLILNKRPVNKRSLMDLRSREVKLYLNKRKVSTENCIEKEELVNRFLRYVDVEPSLQKNGNKKFDFINGLISSLTNSMPNLFEGPGQRDGDGVPSGSPRYSNQSPHATSSWENSRVPADPPTSSNQSSMPGPRDSEQATSSRVEDSRIPGETEAGARGSDPASRATSSRDQDSRIPSDSASSSNQPRSGTDYHSASTSRTDKPTMYRTNEDPAQRKLLKLSDLHSIDEIINLNVKNLKELLFVNRVDFKGCVEKEELTNKVVQLWLDSHTEDPVNLPTEELCKVCMDAPLNSVLLECGHIATCINCGKQLAECPICRQYVVRVVHTFKA